MRSLNFLLFFFIGVSTKCPTGSIYKKEFNRCYSFVKQRLSFERAEKVCIDLGGHLASIHSEAEERFIAETAKLTHNSSDAVWIGAFKIGCKNYFWADGSAFKYHNFSDGDFDAGRCALMESKGQWIKCNCNKKFRAVCSIPQLTPATTTSSSSNPTEPTAPATTTSTSPCPTLPRCPTCPTLPPTTTVTSTVSTPTPTCPECPSLPRCPTCPTMPPIATTTTAVHTPAPTCPICPAIPTCPPPRQCPSCPKPPTCPAPTRCTKPPGCPPPRPCPECQRKPRCETGWTYLPKTNSCYRSFDGDNFWKSEQICKKESSHLASIHSEQENSLAIHLTSARWKLPYPNQVWIGLHRKKGGQPFVWTDGSKVDFRKFAQGQPDQTPNEDCVQLLPDDVDTPSAGGRDQLKTRWNNINCGTKMRAIICKKKALY